LATEACNCPGVILGDWGRAENYAVNMIGDLNSWSVGWTDWNMLLDMQGGPNHLNGFCDAHLVGDANAQVPHIQPSYYYYGHLSKFFLPGSTRVDAQCMQMNGGQNIGGCPVSVTAAMTEDQHLVVSVLNTGDSEQKLSINIGGSEVEYTMPGHSMITMKGTNVHPPPTSAATTGSTETTDTTPTSADTTATVTDTTDTNNVVTGSEGLVTDTEGISESSILTFDWLFFALLAHFLI